MQIDYYLPGPRGHPVLNHVDEKYLTFAGMQMKRAEVAADHPQSIGYHVVTEEEYKELRKTLVTTCCRKCNKPIVASSDESNPLCNDCLQEEEADDEN